MSLLELRGITKNFGAIEALQGVDLEIDPGEAVGLMGDNGAGKSTLMKIIAGNYPPTDGSMRMDGEYVQFSKPIDARRNGIEIVYQDLALCNNLTAAANVFLGRERRRRIGPIRYLDYRAMYQRAGELFSELILTAAARGLVAAVSGFDRILPKQLSRMGGRVPAVPLRREKVPNTLVIGSP